MAVATRSLHGEAVLEGDAKLRLMAFCSYGQCRSDSEKRGPI